MGKTLDKGTISAVLNLNEVDKELIAALMKDFNAHIGVDKRESHRLVWFKKYL